MPRLLAPLLACLCLSLALAGPATAKGRVKVAILPVGVHALEGHEYLQSGLADMLASRIGQYEGVSVVRIEDDTAATSNAQKARESAKAVGADYVVFGSFTNFGQGASLDLVCIATPEGSKVRDVFVQAGTLGEIIPKLDQVAERVARFALTGDPAPSPAVAAAPPGDGDGATPASAGEPSLAERVEALERIVFGADAKAEPVEEEDLRAQSGE
jgi:TolB-like protein